MDLLHFGLLVLQASSLEVEDQDDSDRYEETRDIRQLASQPHVQHRLASSSSIISVLCLYVAILSRKYKMATIGFALVALSFRHQSSLPTWNSTTTPSSGFDLHTFFVLSQLTCGFATYAALTKRYWLSALGCLLNAILMNFHRDGLSQGPRWLPI